MAARRVGAGDRGGRGPPGLRDDLRDRVASARLNREPVVVPDPPLWMSVRGVARAWGVPPWHVEHPDRPPTEAEASRWYHREAALRGMGI